MPLIGFITLGVGFIVIVWALTVYNSIIRAKNDVENNTSTIQTVLQNRYDLIPNLVEVVKQYTQHEQSIIDQVTTMRAQLVNNTGVSATTAQEEAHLTGALKTVFALSESYPDLKANTTFIRLQDQWSELEDRLQAARRGYNYAVTTLRNKQEMFPSNLIAGIMTLKQYELFDSSTQAKDPLSAKDLFAK